MKRNREILIVAPPGRPRDNLLTVAASVIQRCQIHLVDSWRLLIETDPQTLPDLILVDYREPTSELDNVILGLVKNKPLALIIVLIFHQGIINDFSSPGIIESVFGDVSSRHISEWVNRIYCECSNREYH